MKDIGCIRSACRIDSIRAYGMCGLSFAAGLSCPCPLAFFLPPALEEVVVEEMVSHCGCMSNDDIRSGCACWWWAIVTDDTAIVSDSDSGSSSSISSSSRCLPFEFNELAHVLPLLGTERWDMMYGAKMNKSTGSGSRHAFQPGRRATTRQHNVRRV